MDTSIDMDIRHDLYSNCAQDVFINILRYYGMNERCLLSSGWNFVYDCQHKEKKFGERINIYHGDFFELEDALKKFYGIMLIHKNIGRYEEIMAVVVENITKGRPICLYMDSYYCPWQLGCNKFHNMHLLIIRGIKADKLVCSDPYLNKREVLLGDKELEMCNKEVMTIDWVTDCSFSDKEIARDSLNKLFVKKNELNSFDKIRQFSTDLSNNKELLDMEMSINEIAFISIIRKVNYVCYGRMSYKRFIEELENKCDEKKYKLLEEEIEKLGRKWSIIGNRLIKYKLQGCSCSVFTRICEDLLRVAEIEEDIASKLLEVL